MPDRHALGPVFLAIGPDLLGVRTATIYPMDTRSAPYFSRSARISRAGATSQASKPSTRLISLAMAANHPSGARKSGRALAAATEGGATGSPGPGTAEKARPGSRAG